MEKVKQQRKMVVFDLDNTLLQEKFMDACAKHFNFYQALTLLRHIDQDPVSLARRTASFMIGKNIHDLLRIAASLPFVKDLTIATRRLKERTYVIGTISDTYNPVADSIGKKIDADFNIAYELELEGDYITGEVLIPESFLHSAESNCRHRVCKVNALRFVCNSYNVPIENVIVVGFDEGEACLLKDVGKHVPLCISNDLLTSVAKQRMVQKTMKMLLMSAS